MEEKGALATIIVGGAEVGRGKRIQLGSQESESNININSFFHVLNKLPALDY